MNSHVDAPRRRLHLVTAAATPKPTAPEHEATKPEIPQLGETEARQIAEGVLQYQTLQDEFEAEVQSGMPDLDHVTDLIMKLAACRKQLLAFAERVRA
jgi:hypothetical protein